MDTVAQWLGVLVPGPYGSIAIAVLGLSAVVEKGARPEAISDVANIWNSGWDPNYFEPRSFAERIFRYTFGSRHLSLKCLGRSLLVSVLVIIVLLSASELKFELIPPPSNTIAASVLVTIIADYLLLAKTRMLLARLRLSSARVPIFTILIDFFTTAVIVFISGIIADLFFRLIAQHQSTASSTTSIPVFTFELKEVISSAVDNMLDTRFIHELTLPFQSSDDDPHYLRTVFLLAPFVSCLWVLLTVVTSAVIQAFSPVRIFMKWLLPIERKPITGFGLVGAGVTLTFGVLAHAISAVFG